MLASLITLDTDLLNTMRSIVNPDSVWQLKLIHIWSDLEVALVVLLLIGLWLYGVYSKNDQEKRDALMIFYSIALAFGIYVVLNLGLPMRPRPETVSAIRPLVDHLPDNSFPSGHAIFFGASTLAAFFYTRRWIAWLLFATGLIMVFSRILAGIHYPGDILAGSILGCVGAYGIYRLRDTRMVTDCFLAYPIRIAKWVRL